MKKYLIAGFMQEVGAVTGDFEALNKEDAIKQAKDAGFYKIIGVEEL